MSHQQILSFGLSALTKHKGIRIFSANKYFLQNSTNEQLKDGPITPKQDDITMMQGVRHLANTPHRSYIFCRITRSTLSTTYP